jgi:hypothetical protein
MHIDHDEGVHQALETLLLRVVQGHGGGWHSVDFFGQRDRADGHQEASLFLLRIETLMIKSLEKSMKSECVGRLSAFVGAELRPGADEIGVLTSFSGQASH